MGWTTEVDHNEKALGPVLALKPYFAQVCSEEQKEGVILRFIWEGVELFNCLLYIYTKRRKSQYDTKG